MERLKINTKSFNFSNREFCCQRRTTAVPSGLSFSTPSEHLGTYTQLE